MDEELRGLRSGGPVPGAPNSFGDASATARNPGTAQVSTRAVVPSTQPNWVHGDSARAAPLTPGTSVVPSNRPNWVYGNNAPSPATDAPFRTSGGNPNVPPGGSAEAQAFRAQQAAGVGPQQPAGPAPSAKPTTPRDAGFRAGQAIRRGGVAPGVAPALVVGGTAGALFGAGDADSTARYAKRFGVDEPTGDGSVGDLAKFTALRAGGFASDLGVGALDTGTAIVNGVRHLAGAQPIPTFRSLLFRDGDPSSPAAVDSAAQLPRAPATDPRDARNAAMLDAAGAAQAAAGPTNVVTRDGNNFSGSDVREGFTYAGKGLRGVTPGLAPSPDKEALAREARASAILQDTIGTQRGVDEFNRGSPGMGGFRDSRVDDFNKFAREANMNTAVGHMTPRARAETLAGLRQQDLGAEAQHAALAGQRYGQNLTADTTRRGQDLEYQRGLRTNQLTWLNQQREQANKNREFDLREKEFGQRQSEFTAQQALRETEGREKSQKALTDEIAGYLPPDRDGKPDLANAARHAAGFNAAAAQFAELLPPDQRARFAKEGMGALDATDKQRVLAGMQLTDVANATATGSWTPWGTRAIQSNAPIMALRKLPNGDYQTNRTGVNGETEVIPGRYVEKEGSTFGFGGQATNRFKHLIVKG